MATTRSPDSRSKGQRWRWLVVLVVMALATTMTAAVAQTDQTEPTDQGIPATALEQVRADFVRYAAVSDNCPRLGSPGNPEITRRLSQVTQTELEAMYVAVPDLGAFSDAVDTIADYCRGADLIPGIARESTDGPTANVQAVTGAGYPPDYPNPNTQSDWRANIAFLTDEKGKLLGGPTNRTDANEVLKTQFGHEALLYAAVIAQTACDASLVAAPAVCPVAGTAWTLYSVNLMILERANFHDVVINGAEIEAAYENTVIALANQGEMDARLDDIEARLDTMEERQLEIIRLLHTPEGSRTSDVPACDGQPCDYPYKPQK